MDDRERERERKKKKRAKYGTGYKMSCICTIIIKNNKTSRERVIHPG